MSLFGPNKGEREMNFTEGYLSKALQRETVSQETAKQLLASGSAVLPANKKRKNIEKPCIIGKGFLVKVNANIGFSRGHSSQAEEIEKLKVAVDNGADAIMDLSTGSGIVQMRREVLSLCPVPVGTVPIYELACGVDKAFLDLSEDDFMAVLEQQAEDGVDFFTVHSGITLQAARALQHGNRVIKIVSRGGALLAKWMLHNSRENPFLSRYDDMLALAKDYNIVLSLGDSLRPGAVADASDRFQIDELSLLGELQQRAFSKGVQVMIEGPGHMTMDQIAANVKLQKCLCHQAPFYVLGPLVTDAACGWDHISGAIGGAIAAYHGADFLCYVTPAEHVSLPDAEDVKEGVIASKIAAHAADLARGTRSSLERDLAISSARAKRDWKTQFALSIDPVKPRKKRELSGAGEQDICTMCSEMCSIKMVEDDLNAKEHSDES